MEPSLHTTFGLQIDRIRQSLISCAPLVKPTPVLRSKTYQPPPRRYVTKACPCGRGIYERRQTCWACRRRAARARARAGQLTVCACGQRKQAASVVCYRCAKAAGRGAQ